MYKMPKKRVRRKTRKSAVKPVMVRSSKQRINLVARRLIFFVILFVLSLVLNVAISNEIWKNLFAMLTLIFGFVSLAFLIVLLILWFMKIIRK